MTQREFLSYFLARCPRCDSVAKWTGTAEVADRPDWTRVTYAIGCHCSDQPVIVVLWPMRLGIYIDLMYQSYPDIEQAAS